MSEKSGKSVPDDRQRTEKQIADLVPYVAESAVDAVRDALLRIVVENREHSEILDLLLPKLEQMPSKRSEALDWLDDELGRLNDDDVISFMDRLERVGGHELRLELESKPVPRPQIRRSLWATVAVAVAMCTVLTYGWASAVVSQRAEERENQDLRVKLAVDAAKLQAKSARIAELDAKLDRLYEAQGNMLKMHHTLISNDVFDREQWVNYIGWLKKAMDAWNRSIENEIREEKEAQDEP